MGADSSWADPRAMLTECARGKPQGIPIIMSKIDTTHVSLALRIMTVDFIEYGEMQNVFSHFVEFSGSFLQS